MGTIQPTRFLANTGQILPGVRRIVNVAQPAAGQPSVITVPGGEQWIVLSAMVTLVTDANAFTRQPFATISIDNQIVWQSALTSGVAASSTNPLTLSSVIGSQNLQGTGGTSVSVLPNAALPPGSQIKVCTAGSIDNNDQVSAGVYWVERYYFTDAMLSEIERKIERWELLDAEQRAYAQTGQGG